MWFLLLALWAKAVEPPQTCIDPARIRVAYQDAARAGMGRFGEITAPVAAQHTIDLILSHIEQPGAPAHIPASALFFVESDAFIDIRIVDRRGCAGPQIIVRGATAAAMLGIPV